MRSAVYRDKKLIGFFDASAAELIGEQSSSPYEVQETGSCRYITLYRLPTGDFVLHERGWDEFSGHVDNGAEIVSRSAAAAWCAEQAIQPPGDLMNELGLIDFTPNAPPPLAAPVAPPPPPADGPYPPHRFRWKTVDGAFEATQRRLYRLLWVAWPLFPNGTLHLDEVVRGIENQGGDAVSKKTLVNYARDLTRYLSGRFGFPHKLVLDGDYLKWDVNPDAELSADF